MVKKKHEEYKVHKLRHILLHQHLDELMADFILHSKKLPSKTTVMELVLWSHQQTIEPTGGYSDKER